MASKDKESRLAQMADWEEQLSKRLSKLAEEGVASEKISKDPQVKKIRAKIRETRDRLTAIEKKEQKLEEMAKARAEKAAAHQKREEKEKGN